MTDSAPIADGSYDAIVVDASEPTDGAAGVHLELTIVAGEHKGAVLEVRTTESASDDPIFLLGIPATITVQAGVPSVRLEP